MKQYAIVTPGFKDQSTFYRCHMAFAPFKNKVKFHFMDSIEEHQAYYFDVIYMQRPYAKEHVAMAHYAKRWGIKLWVDYDDLMTNVPRHSPAYTAHLDSEEHIKKILDLSDIASFSTPELKKQLLDESNEKGCVIPNAFPFEPPASPNTESRTILWRGSMTHNRDHTIIGPYCISIAAKYPEWKWVFCGDLPWWSTYIKNSEWAHWMEVGDYLQAIRHMRPRILLAPLELTVFNLCKSNISWLEATYSGAVCLASKLPEFRYASHFTETTFLDELTSLMKNTQYYERKYADALKGLEDYSFEKAKMLRSIIIDMLGMSDLKFNSMPPIKPRDITKLHVAHDIEADPEGEQDAKEDCA